MPASKKDDTDKVFDVSKPGKTPAAASGRPLIIGHKPMMKDPMVKDAAATDMDEDQTVKIDQPLEEDIPSGSPPLPAPDDMPSLEAENEQEAPSEARLIINPPDEKTGEKTGEKTDPDKSDTADKSEPTETEDDSKVEVKVTKSAAKTEIKDDKDASIAPDDKSSDATVVPVASAVKKPKTEVGEMTLEPINKNVKPEETKPSDDKGTKDSTDSDADVIKITKEDTTEPAKTEDTSTEKPEEAAEDAGDAEDGEAKTGGDAAKSDSDNEVNDEGTPADIEAQKKAEEAAKAEAAKQAQIDKLIANKQYFVPIGEKTRKRRSLKNTLTGIFLILLLGAALAYLMADVGIIKTKIKLPYHFFKQTAVETSTTPAAADTTSTPVQTPVDPYKTWKSVCDSTTKLCIKYPLTWKAVAVNDSKSKGTLIINDKITISGGYGNVDPSVNNSNEMDTSNPLSDATPSAQIVMQLSDPAKFYVDSVTDLYKKDSNYKVLGGYFVGTTENIPVFEVINASLVSKLSIMAGKTIELPSTAFNLTPTKAQTTNDVLVGANPISNKSYTADQAKAWLTSTDGKAAQLFVQSFYSQ